MSQKKPYRNNGNYNNNNDNSKPYNRNNNNYNNKGNIDGVPKLTYGSNSNYIQWKEALFKACMVKYEHLGSCIQTGEYYEPPEIITNTYVKAQDPNGFILESLKSQIKCRQSEISEMVKKRPGMYGYILSTLSAESEDKIKSDSTYDAFNLEKDPLALFNCINKHHGSGAGHISKEFGKSGARSEYLHIKQMSYESLVAFRTRFDQKLQNYVAYGNDPIKPEDIAMDFFHALDDVRYKPYKIHTMNQSSRGIGS